MQPPTKCKLVTVPRSTFIPQTSQLSTHPQMARKMTSGRTKEQSANVEREKKRKKEGIKWRQDLYRRWRDATDCKTAKQTLINVMSISVISVLHPAHRKCDRNHSEYE